MVLLRTFHLDYCPKNLQKTTHLNKKISRRTLNTLTSRVLCPRRVPIISGALGIIIYYPVYIGNHNFLVGQKWGCHEFEHLKDPINLYSLNVFPYNYLYYIYVVTYVGLPTPKKYQSFCTIRRFIKFVVVSSVSLKS